MEVPFLQPTDGMLVIRPQVPCKEDGTPEDGYVPYAWASSENTRYYLREIRGAEGYEPNPTVIPVVVGIYSIYTDAGTAEDGVSVRAGVGELYHTMRKYASDGDVNITLRDMKAVGQMQPSKEFQLYGWKNKGEDINLHYGINPEQGMDYGRHDSENWLSPFLETQTGFLRTRVEQNTDALAKGTYGESNPTANWDDLGGEDLTGLFSLLNIVVVENKRPPKELQVRKVNGKGKALNGAKFAVYANKEDAEKGGNALSTGATATVDGIDGMLIFDSSKGSTDGSDGRAKMNWNDYEGQYLYLKEIEAPKGYRLKKTLIRLYVDENTVYADAGISGDGVSVMLRPEKEHSDEEPDEPEFIFDKPPVQTPKRKRVWCADIHRRRGMSPISGGGALWLQFLLPESVWQDMACMRNTGKLWRMDQKGEKSLPNGRNGWRGKDDEADNDTGNYKKGI